MKTLMMIFISVWLINITSNFICALFFEKTASEVGYTMGVKTRHYFTGGK